MSPTNNQVEAAIYRVSNASREEWWKTRAGRHLGSWLEAGGLLVRKIEARYECYPDSKVIAQYLASQLEQAGEIDCAAALHEWASLPWSLFAQSWVSAIAVK